MIYPSFVSTSALLQDTRSSIARTQAKLAEAQVELSTGRHADQGLTLGAKTGVALSMRQEQMQLQAVRESNTLAATRLTSTQTSLQDLSDLAQGFLSAIVRGRTSTASPATLVTEAQSGFKAMIDRLNTTVGGQHIFSGINSDVQPFEDYFASAPPASRQAVANAFQTQFGFSQSSPSANTIPQSAMQTFLDTGFDGLFASPNWETNWSAASDRNVRSRISRNELAESSANANDQAFRDLAAAFTMVGDLGFENLNDNARGAVLDKAVRLTGNAIGGIAKLQSSLGVTQERLAASSGVIDIQLKHLSSSIDDLESVDANEVATRLTGLMNQMEIAYSITKRVHDLSIMNFL